MTPSPSLSAHNPLAAISALDGNPRRGSARQDGALHPYGGCEMWLSWTPGQGLTNDPGHPGGDHHCCGKPGPRQFLHQAMTHPAGMAGCEVCCSMNAAEGTGTMSSSRKPPKPNRQRTEGSHSGTGDAPGLSGTRVLPHGRVCRPAPGPTRGRHPRPHAGQAGSVAPAAPWAPHAGPS